MLRHFLLSVKAYFVWPCNPETFHRGQALQTLTQERRVAQAIWDHPGHSVTTLRISSKMEKSLCNAHATGVCSYLFDSILNCGDGRFSIAYSQAGGYCRQRAVLDHAGAYAKAWRPNSSQAQNRPPSRPALTTPRVAPKPDRQATFRSRPFCLRAAESRPFGT